MCGTQYTIPSPILYYLCANGLDWLKWTFQLQSQVHRTECSGLTPVGSQALLSCLLASTSYLHVGQGKREGSVKARKLMECHKNSEREVDGKKKKSK